MPDLTADIDVIAKGSYTNALDLSTVTDALDQKFKTDLADGTGADQADQLFHDQRTLSASANEELDLAGGLSDAFGNTLTFARIKAIVISAASGNTNSVLVGGAAANAFINWVSNASDEVIVRPGGTFALVAPDATAYAVTASTGDLLRIENSGAGTSVTYDIILIGASA